MRILRELHPDPGANLLAVGSAEKSPESSQACTKCVGIKMQALAPVILKKKVNYGSVGNGGKEDVHLQPHELLFFPFCCGGGGFSFQNGFRNSSQLTQLKSTAEKPG